MSRSPKPGPFDFDREAIDREIIATLPEGTIFDKEKADRVVDFIQALKNTKGRFYGKPFRLLDWEYKLVRQAYGTIDEKTGSRRYKRIYLEIAKKNGKSELVAALALYHLFFDNEPNGEIYGCAGDREQASIIFYTAVEMIELSPTLKKRSRITGQKKGSTSPKSITDLETASLYKVVSAEAYTKHGLNLSACLFDELHVQPNRDLYDVMSKGAGDAREQPIWWYITTAGDDPDRVTIGWEVHEKAETILKAREAGDESKDLPTWLPVIFSYAGEDIYNEKNWKLANPSLGHTFPIEAMREAALDARQSPADERLFRWLRLNQWTTVKLTGWLPLDLWDQTTVASDWTRNVLLGKECYPGLDLSSTIDLSALCLIFPPQEGLEKWQVIWDCFIPEENMRERIQEDKVPYDKWAADGWIIPTPGNVIDYTRIENRVVEASQMYKFVSIDNKGNGGGGADMKFAAMLVQRLKENHNIDFVDIPQYYAHLTEPMQYIEVLLKNKQLEHEAHPVARWCFGNTSIASNGSGYIKYVKETKGKGVRRTKRIDCTAAWVIGMARAKFYERKVDLSRILDDDWGM